VFTTVHHGALNSVHSSKLSNSKPYVTLGNVGDFIFNLLEPEFYISILAHSVGKMRIIQEPNKAVL